MADFSADVREQVQELLRRIVDGSIEPYIGARALWTDFYSNDPGSFPELVTFVNDATDYEELPDRRPEIVQHIVGEAERTLTQWS
jgi:hypothetical protein